jgi:hypothetical protein
VADQIPFALTLAFARTVTIPTIGLSLEITHSIARAA